MRIPKDTADVTRGTALMFISKLAKTLLELVSITCLRLLAPRTI
jgi:hypothetical protein